jgi:hypothetical protein
VAKYREKPVLVEASQWFKNGDHPEDDCKFIRDYCDNNSDYVEFLSEGKVVRRYRNPDTGGTNRCKICHIILHEHGWVDTLEGGHIVCPGDWIITDIKGEKYPCKPDIFEKIYEKVQE